MRFYAIRHGETVWNTQRRLQGDTDVPLNENGIRQAREAKARIAQYPIDLIVSSTLQRARDTANILNEALHCEIQYTDDLVERGYGEFEGLTPEEYADDTVKSSGQLSHYESNLQYRGVEPVQTLCARIGGVIDRLRTEHPGKNVLLVTHGGAIRAVEYYFHGLRPDGTLPNPRPNNCQIFEYEC